MLRQVNQPAHSISVGEGPPVILIHGIGASIYTWNYQIPALTEAGFKVYALDLLGHGESHKPEDHREYSVVEVQNHFNRWVEGLDLDEPVTLIGHSIGAYMSIEYALKHPENVKQLVMVNPFFKPNQLSTVLKHMTRGLTVSGKFIRKIPFWLMRPFIRWNRNIAANLPGPMVSQIALDFMRAHPNFIYTVPSAHDLSPYLKDLRSPTLVIFGEKDRTLDRESFVHLADSIPDCVYEKVSGAGHTPHLTESKATNQLILDFISSAGENV